MREFFGMPAGTCDVLLADQGLPSFPNQQIAGKKIHIVRFLDAEKIGQEYRLDNLLQLSAEK